MNPFIGEFTMHVAALEYSGNTCTHNCCYCFSNIRNKNRVAAFEATRRFIADAKNRETTEAVLFNDGQAICISNNVDPFSETNYRQTHSLLKLLVQYPNGIFFQTKTGTGLDEAVEILGSNGKKNVIFYITITCFDDKTSKIVEPGAPVTSERVRWAYKLRELGYHVIIGFNPHVHTWMSGDELHQMVADFKKHDVRYFFMMPLHISKKEITMLNEGQCKRYVGMDLTDIGSFLKVNMRSFTTVVSEMQSDKDIHAFAMGMPFPSDFDTDSRKVLGKTFATSYSFLNYMHERFDQERFTFDEYYKVMSQGNEELFERPFKRLDAYIFRKARQVWKGNEAVQSIKTFKEVLRVWWNDKRIHETIQNRWLTRNGLDVEGKPYEGFGTDKLYVMWNSGLDADGNVVLRITKKGGEAI